MSVQAAEESARVEWTAEPVADLRPDSVVVGERAGRVRRAGGGRVVRHRALQPHVASLVELLRLRAADTPDRRAYSFVTGKDGREVHITYAELDCAARGVAARLRADLGPRDRVLLMYPPGLDFIAALFGCLYAGVIAVPTSPSNERLGAITSNCTPRAVLTVGAMQASFQQRCREIASLEDARWYVSDAIDPSIAETWQDPGVRPDSLAFLQYTSGSTGSPKGVMVTHGNLIHNQRMIVDGFRLPTEWCGVSWLPLFHDMGLIGAVMVALYTGAPTTFMSPATFVQQPVRWLRAISNAGAPTVSGAPNFGYEMCTRRISPEDRETLDLSRWIVAYNGSEVVRAETLERFAETFKPCGFRAQALSPCYGLAEASLIVTGSDPSSPYRMRGVDDQALLRNEIVDRPAGAVGTKRLVSSGRPLVDTRIAIVDPDTRLRRPSGRIGEIWIANASIAQGYWNRPDVSHATFRARLADTGEGPFLRTGDLGFMHEGELWITGRLKDLIIVSGLNHYPDDIERTAQESHPALRPGCGAAFAVDCDAEERLVLVNEASLSELGETSPEELLASTRKTIARHHGIHLFDLVLIRSGTLPKTSSGKIRRVECRERYLAGGFERGPRARAPLKRERVADDGGARPGLLRAGETLR